VSFRIGSRLFSPRPFTSLVTLALLVLLVSLGRWQLSRAEQKRVLYDEFAQGTEATLGIDSHTAPVARYLHVEARGHYDAARQILIDNMVMNERVGYYVITPFQLEDGAWLLVNRGWVPVGASRAEKPAIPADGAERRIRGRADHLPSPGIQMGVRPRLAAPYPVVSNYPQAPEIAALLGEARWAAATPVVLLDAGEPEGFLRQWTPPGFPPLRHIGYAVQWFALALALLVIYLVVNSRRIGAPGTVQA
jgi:surfeit locus 1 family protein